MAQAIKSLWKISRALEQTFKQLTYYTARHLAHSKTYGADFIDEYKRISAKIQKEKDKDRIKRNKKFKNEKDQLKKKLQEAKARNEEKERERRQKRARRDRGSSGSQSSSNSVQMQSDDQRPNNQREKDKERAIREKKELKAVEKRKDDQRESLELDYERDFDFNRPYKSQSKKDSMEEQRERKRQPKARANNEKISKWSERNPSSLSCIDSDKYKILAVDEQNSDFEDENALLKVPQIKPREPLTPYFLFLRKNRYSILKGFPVIHEKGNFGEIWKNLREEEKKPYQDQYIRAQQIYAKKMAQYYAVNPRSVEERNRVMQEVEEAANQEQEKLEAQNKKPQSKNKAKTTQTGKGRGGKGGRGRKKDNIYEE